MLLALRCGVDERLRRCSNSAKAHLLCLNVLAVCFSSEIEMRDYPGAVDRTSNLSDNDQKIRKTYVHAILIKSPSTVGDRKQQAGKIAAFT